MKSWEILRMDISLLKFVESICLSEGVGYNSIVMMEGEENGDLFSSGRI